MLWKLRTLLSAIACCVLSTACQVNQADGPPQETGQLPLSPSLERTTNIVIPWGTADHQLGLEHELAGHPARGPMSVALTPGGRIAVLDNLNSRVALFTPSGDFAGAVKTGSMNSDLAIMPDGAVALLNLAAMTIRWAGQSGEESDAMQIGPAFKTASGIDFVQGQLRLATAYQESYPVQPRMLQRKEEGLPSHGQGFYQVIADRESPGRHHVLEAVVPKVKGDGQAMKTVWSFQSTCSALFPLLALEDGRQVHVCDTHVGADAEPQVRRSIEVLSSSGETASMALEVQPLYTMFRAYRTYRDVVLVAQPGTDGLLVTLWTPGREVSP